MSRIQRSTPLYLWHLLSARVSAVGVATYGLVALFCLPACVPLDDAADEESAAVVAAPERLAAGDHEIFIEHGDRKRRAVLHVPTGLSEQQLGALPLVVVLHGGGGNAKIAQKTTRFAELADREGFLAVFPDGTGKFDRALLTWNCTGLPVYAVENDVDDVGYLRALVAEIDHRTPVDMDRVFATGMSNGGMMCHRLAREASDLFAAVADVAGAMHYTATEPSEPISILMIHGRDDAHVPYEGGRPEKSVGGSGDRTDPSVETAAKYYVNRLGLADEPVRTKSGKVMTERWSLPSADQTPPAPSVPEVIVVSIDEEGHTWPGSQAPRRRAAKPTQEYDASERIWEFFRDHPRAPHRQ